MDERYSPFPIEHYFAPTEHCEVRVLAAAEEPGKLWNLYWLSRHSSEPTGKVTLQQWAAYAQYSPLLVRAVIFDALKHREMYHALAQPPLVFGEWLANYPHHHTLHCYSLSGNAWLKQAVSRANEAATLRLRKEPVVRWVAGKMEVTLANTS